MSRINAAIVNISLVLITACTVVVTVLLVQRTLNPDIQSAARRTRPHEVVADWESVSAVGHRMGSDAAAMTLVVFGDFQCPSCAVFATMTLPNFRGRYLDEIAVVYRHWPLPQHPLAFAAAKASECAAVQDRFEAYHDALYEQQDRIGARELVSFAVDADVADTAKFSRCLESDFAEAAIKRDIAAARAIRGTGTPTVVVDGLLLRGIINDALLDSLATESGLRRR